jgi:hypothetical protein
LHWLECEYCCERLHELCLIALRVDLQPERV